MLKKSIRVCCFHFFPLLPPHVFAESVPDQCCAKALDVITLPGQQYLQHHPVCVQRIARFKAIAISAQNKNSLPRIFLNNPQTT